ncbi:C40 family peptidase [Frondihabitans peucedani]|uniref:C40 family peptidase n=1 Tax=Frondihabitans peucedani TaxID=598626 RepID=UPI0031D34474
MSPRRAARAAREAAAAAELSSVPSGAPVSPVVAPVVAPIKPASAAAPATAPLTLTGISGLAASVPTAAPGRRQTFVPAEAPLRRTAGRSTASAPRGRAAASTRPAAVPAAPATRAGRGRVFVAARRVTMLTVVCGILATSILPVINASQSKAFASGTGIATTPAVKGSQGYDVASDVDTSVSSRDGYGATSVVDYEKQVIANRQAEKGSTYTGPTAAEYVAHPIFDHLDRAEVFQVALQYLGTPYVHGGADPSAFDCSGLIMFVYAQFGISLPHYVPSQDAMGTTIPQSEAVPGDLVVFDNEAHDGIYAGNGMILDAPKPGGYVSVRPIWNQAHHFVRIGG